GRSSLGLLVVEFAGDPEAVAGDEDAIEDDGRAALVERHALGLEGGHAGAAAELARLAEPEPHGRHALARAIDGDAELELEHLAQRRGAEIRLQHLLADGRGEERALETHRVAVDQPQPLELHDAGARAEAERVGHAAVGARHAPAEQTRGDVLALRGEVAGEAAQLQDVVVDRRRGDEGAEAVTARDQVLTLEHLERLRSEEHTSELQSPDHLVCRLLLEKKNKQSYQL